MFSLRSHALVGLLFPLLGAAACASTADEATDTGGADVTLGAPSADEAGLSPKELLGKRLFEDTNLSEPRGQSCASCHAPSAGFSGNNGSSIAAVARGARGGMFGNRNAPTAMYLARAPRFSFVKEAPENGEPTPSYTPTGGQFWDGRADDLAAQAKGPFLNPREMNNPSAGAVVAKVASGKYAALARSVYGSAIVADTDRAYDAIAEAIAAYEQSKRFQPFASKFDDVLRGTASLSAQEARGFDLFKDPEKGNCVSCHAGDTTSKSPADWLFTDFTYDNIGVPRNAKIPDNADPAYFDLGLCKRPGIETTLPDGVVADDYCGAFKVPTLRNIGKTAPYMHNGYFAELRDVVKFYATRDTSPELWYPKDASGAVDKFDDLPPAYKKNVNTEEVPLERHLGDAPRLTESEIDDVVAFLQTLTDR